MPAQTEYIKTLGTILSENANPKDASFMKKYMRDQFEYFGIRAPKRKELFRGFIREYGYPESEIFEPVIRKLYAMPEREFHYFAMEVVYKNTGKFKPSSVKLFEYMIVTNAWWDTVDFIAANILGKFFRNYPEMVPECTNSWMDSGNLWLQRSCILFQLKYRQNTDIHLLYKFIDRLKDSREFFIQKAIGWMLREYSKSNPLEVLQYVDKTALKPLSRKEATRIINKKVFKLL